MKTRNWLGIAILAGVILLSGWYIPNNINVSVEITFTDSLPLDTVQLSAFAVCLETDDTIQTYQEPKDWDKLQGQSYSSVAAIPDEEIPDKEHEIAIQAPMASLHKVKVSSARLKARDQYIEDHYKTAQAEMNKFGIPASITLAQGILESRSGDSYLAREGNNHFGIKYYNKERIPEGIQAMLKGKNYLARHDDCCTKTTRSKCTGVDKFCHFDRPWASFRYHSYILMKYKRVKKLVSLGDLDYVAWSHAVHKSGYATSKTYALKIIKLIEELELYHYDVLASDKTT